MKIVLKSVPPSLNRFAGRENSWEYRAEKQRWTAAVYYSVRSAKDRPRKPLERADVRITYYFGNRNRHDADNYCGKFLLDGLTKSRVIVDDDFTHIKLTVTGEYDKDRPRTEIIVREA